MSEALSEEQLVDYLIAEGEAVEYGESWTPQTTHEWWQDAEGNRHVRLVQTYHGGGSRGDDDQAEYARRLLDLGRAVLEVHAPENLEELPKEITHIIPSSGVPQRFRRYIAPPEGA